MNWTMRSLQKTWRFDRRIPIDTLRKFVVHVIVVWRYEITTSEWIINLKGIQHDLATCLMRVCCYKICPVLYAQFFAVKTTRKKNRGKKKIWQSIVSRDMSSLRYENACFWFMELCLNRGAKNWCYKNENNWSCWFVLVMALRRELEAWTRREWRQSRLERSHMVV